MDRFSLLPPENPSERDIGGVAKVHAEVSQTLSYSGWPLTYSELARFDGRPRLVSFDRPQVRRPPVAGGPTPFCSACQAIQMPGPCGIRTCWRLRVVGGPGCGCTWSH